MFCSICFNKIPAVGDWTTGNSAEPVNFGRCCNKCDNEVVIPARLAVMANKVSGHEQMAMVKEQFAVMERMVRDYDALFKEDSDADEADQLLDRVEWKTE